MSYVVDGVILNIFLTGYCSGQSSRIPDCSSVCTCLNPDCVINKYKLDKITKPASPLIHCHRKDIFFKLLELYVCSLLRIML